MVLAFNCSRAVGRSEEMHGARDWYWRTVRVPFSHSKLERPFQQKQEQNSLWTGLVPQIPSHRWRYHPKPSGFSRTLNNIVTTCYLRKFSLVSTLQLSSVWSSTISALSSCPLWQVSWPCKFHSCASC